MQRLCTRIESAEFIFVHPYESVAQIGSLSSRTTFSPLRHDR